MSPERLERTLVTTTKRRTRAPVGLLSVEYVGLDSLYVV
jgi:hypothetical protein